MYGSEPQPQQAGSPLASEYLKGANRPRRTSLAIERQLDSAVKSGGNCDAACEISRTSSV